MDVLISMEPKNEAQNKEDKEVKTAESRTEESNTEENQDDQERNGIIPEDLDFKRFMGCGG